MELPDVGKHCAISTCKLLDFLPFVCSQCGNTFCLEHRSFEAHNCTSTKVEEAQIEEKASEVLVNATARKLKCAIMQCKETEYVRIICPECKQNFCLKHRSPSDHNCTSLQKMKDVGVGCKPPAKEVHERIQKAISEFLKFHKNPTARKLVEMRMKRRATVCSMTIQLQSLSRAKRVIKKFPKTSESIWKFFIHTREA